MRSYQERDRAVLWHPATHFRDLDEQPPIVVKRAFGAWLYDENDRPILDAISSWWTSIHGHGHPRMVQAIADQVASFAEKAAPGGSPPWPTAITAKPWAPWRSAVTGFIAIGSRRF